MKNFINRVWLRARPFLAVIGMFAILMYVHGHFFGSFSIFPWKWEEIRRISSPDGLRDGVVLRGIRGAMSSYRFAYLIVSRGERADIRNDLWGDAILVCTAPAPSLEWRDSDCVQLQRSEHKGVWIVYFQAEHWKSKIKVDFSSQGNRPNQALVPTATSVTPAADAPVAPAAAAAHL